jgi:peptidoglycan hydrolase CwlO-like protein
MYSEKCQECKTTGHEYLVGNHYCLSCADKQIDKLQAEKSANEQQFKDDTDMIKKLQNEIDKKNKLIAELAEQIRLHK